MKTLLLWFEPDKEVPRFSRLGWRFEEVSLRDVVVSGVHPWMGASQHLTIVPSLLERLNMLSAKLPGLAHMRYSHDITAPALYTPGNASFLERMLYAVREQVVFVEDLSFLELLEIAKTRLRERWSHTVAESLARMAYVQFQDLRQFLKAKNKRLKLSGYDDLRKYDLGAVLTLGDFDGHDHVILSQGVPTLNFRKATFLEGVTDGEGRLRLLPEIPSFTLSELAENGYTSEMDWRCTQQDGVVELHPDIGGSLDKRARARRAAECWRLDKGRLCFRAPLGRVVQLVEDGVLTPSFPGLDYVREHRQPPASAALLGSSVEGFAVGAALPGPSTVDSLKGLLREYGEPMTGSKEQLLRKVARLAATKYRECEDELETHFRRYRYVRVAKQAPRAQGFPVLEHEPQIKNFLLALYMLRHLRGNSVLDPDHVNDTYSVDDLALAIAEKRTELTGMFLPVNR